MEMELALVCKGNNKRPQRTIEMRRQAAVKVVERLIRAGIVVAADAERSVHDVLKATAYETDGFRIARELENRCRWECDLTTAEELDCFDRILSDIYDVAEKVWDKENPHDPRHKDGDVVQWRGKPAVVCGVYKYRPQCYQIGQGETDGVKSYFVVPFEEVS